MNRLPVALITLGMALLVLNSANAQDLVAIKNAQLFHGAQLFSQDFSPRQPSVQGDGLGPLFNASSCVACHNQGGVGGGGTPEFNAKSVGIDRLDIKGPGIDQQVIAQMVSSFHPGFIDTSGSVVNIFPLPHHGGSPQFHLRTKAVLERSSILFTATGGALDAGEVRAGNATPIHYKNNLGGRSIDLHARVYQRNTTALFGAGLLDKIPLRDIQKQFRLQKRHPEISGRPATLRNGSIGRFGWRGNESSLVNFVDRACAAELGLRTRRRDQPLDPFVPLYKNPGFDISDLDVRAMSAFVAALPRPVERIPESSEDRLLVQQGKRVFESVGCAVCHTPKLGEVAGLYSDLLLHDMGYALMDLNHAEPYIIDRSVHRTVAETAATVGGERMFGYYGSGAFIDLPTSTERSTTSAATVAQLVESVAQCAQRPTSYRTKEGYRFVAPTRPTSPIELIAGPTRSLTLEVEDRTANQSGGGETFQTTEDVTLQIRYQDTNFNQEWRTPPLWGVADSAPYMHDGRASTLLEAITMHGGEATGTRDRFLLLSHQDREALLMFLGTLVAPPVPSQPGNGQPGPVVAKH